MPRTLKIMKQPRSYYSLSTLLFNLITPLVARNSEFHGQSEIFGRVLIMLRLWVCQGSEYTKVYIHATARDIFETLEFLEDFLFWHIKVCLGIFNHCSDTFGHVCNSV